MRGVSRRRALAAVAGIAAAAAGCLEGSTDDPNETETTGSDSDGSADGDSTGGTAEETTEGSGEGTADGGTSDADDSTTAPSDDDLDLREANVVGVELEAASGGTRFSVTLFHDDDGEDGYANWWNVETREGEELGRRDLAHAHGTQEFTRSATISVPDDVSCVVVRGHDGTHEYGGRAAVVTVDSGATRSVDQGSDPQSFADATCP